MLSTPPTLLLGLGARLLAERLFHPDASPRIGHTLLTGLWQGVLLYYVLMAYSTVAPAVGIGIVVRLVADFVITRDALQAAATLLGVALGVLGTDILAQMLEDGMYTERRAEVSRSILGVSSSSTVVPERSRRARLVQFRRSIDGESRSSRRRLPTETTTAGAPSITSSDTLDPNGTMTPLEREVAALRTRASLADTERRRYREEKKWALAQGNPARAAQMAWQVRRYAALAQSFHREADARIVEASNRERESRQHPMPLSRPPSQDLRQHHRTVSVEIGGRQRKTSANRQSAVRVQVH